MLRADLGSAGGLVTRTDPPSASVWQDNPRPTRLCAVLLQSGRRRPELGDGPFTWGVSRQHRDHTCISFDDAVARDGARSDPMGFVADLEARPPILVPARERHGHFRLSESWIMTWAAPRSRMSRTIDVQDFPSNGLPVPAGSILELKAATGSAKLLESLLRYQAWIILS